MTTAVIQERLFCCNCGVEVRQGESGEAAPHEDGGHSYVWCKECARNEFQAAPEHVPPDSPRTRLHMFIWASSEGRRTHECEAQVGPQHVGKLLQQLASEQRVRNSHDDVWVACCSPWEKPPPKQPDSRQPGPTEPDNYEDLLGERRFVISARAYDDLLHRVAVVEQRVELVIRSVEGLCHKIEDEQKRQEHKAKIPFSGED